MTDSVIIKNNVNVKNTPFNWPVVGFLLFMAGIPGLPAIFILALVAIGPSSGEGISSMINTLHFGTPTAVFVHGGAGILFFLTMPYQFSPAIRVKNLKLHKTGGLIALLSGYIMGLSAIWMHHVLLPDVFGSRYVVLLMMSIAMCIAFSLGLWHIINGNVQSHRKWMIRAVAITLAAVTPLFVETFIFLLFGQFENIFAVIIPFLNDYDRLVGIAINLTIVEYIFLNEKFKQKSQERLMMLEEK